MEGAHVVATASRPSFRYLERIGVDVIIGYKAERFEKKVTGVDVVIDPITWGRRTGVSSSGVRRSTAPGKRLST